MCRVNRRANWPLVRPRHLRGDPGARTGNKPHLPLQVRTGDRQAQQQPGAGGKTYVRTLQPRDFDNPPVGAREHGGGLIKSGGWVNIRRLRIPTKPAGH